MESHPKSKWARPASAPAFLLIALAVLGAALILLRNHPYGPAITRHSIIVYIGTAESLLAGEGWTTPYGPQAIFGPLYSALLALLGFLSGFEPHAVAGPLNALLFGLTVFIAGHWLRQRITSRWLALWGLLALVFSPLTRMFDYPMSEPLFIFLTTAALFCMDRFLREGRRAALIQAALFMVLACLTRNAGGLLVISLGILLLLRPGARPLERMKHCAAFILICGILFSPRLLYGMLVSGKPFGNDVGWPTHTMSDFLKTTFSSLKGWITPGLPAEDAIALGAVMLSALAIAFGFALVRRRPWHTFYLCGGLVLGYFISMTILAKFLHLQTGMGQVSSHWVGHRYWTPMYIPLLIALVFLLDRWLIWPRPPRGGGGGAHPPLPSDSRGERRCLPSCSSSGLAAPLNSTDRTSSAPAKDKTNTGRARSTSMMMCFVSSERRRRQARSISTRAECRVQSFSTLSTIIRDDLTATCIFCQKNWSGCRKRSRRLRRVNCWSGFTTIRRRHTAESIAMACLNWMRCRPCSEWPACQAASSFESGDSHLAEAAASTLARTTRL